MMDKKNKVYPDFVPNQVLTNHQLNQMRDYLDQENRLGRIRLVGTGIVCGLNVAVDGQSRITVSDGFGVSSDGYILEHNTSDNGGGQYTHLRDYADPHLDEDGTLLYEPWQKSGNPSSQISILELVGESDGGVKIDPDKLLGKVLVVYLEKNNVKLDSCLVTDCDSKGVNVQSQLRLLLIDKNELQQIAPCESARGKMLTIPRLHTVLNLTVVEKSQQINESYGQICKSIFEEVQKKITQAFKEYAGVLHLEVEDLSIVQKLERIFEKPGQYSWDILNDIADAYNEFIDAVCHIIAPCMEELQFPRHLMLGSFDAEGYRNEFKPSTVRNVMHNDLERVRKLFLRILAIIESIEMTDVDAIAITPSSSSLYPLGQRALPFYYSPKLEELWQPQMCCTTADVWSYHFREKVKDFEYAKASFLRIEGHIGTSCEEAFKRIRELQFSFNLEFDLLSLKIAKHEQGEDTVASLAKAIPGMEHTAGVVKGGTFLLVCDDETGQVVADFSLEGRVPCCRYLEPSEPPVDRLGSIGGIFVDENGGALNGAQVVLRDGDGFFLQEQLSSDKAEFLFKDLQAGTYLLRGQLVVDGGTVMVSDLLGVDLAENDEQIVKLIGNNFDNVASSLIEGRVLTENQEVIANADVLLNPGNQRLKSGVEGDFVFKELRADIYTLQASLTLLDPGGKKISSAPVLVKLDIGDEVKQNLILPKTGDGATSLEISLVDSLSGKGVTKAKVTVSSQVGRVFKTTLDAPNTDSRHFLFTGLKEGSFIATVEATGFKGASQRDIKVEANKNTQLELKLQRA